MEKLTLNEIMKLMEMCYIDMELNPNKDNKALISKLAKIYIQEELKETQE